MLSGLYGRKTSPGQPWAAGSWREEASIYHDNSCCDASQMGNKHIPQVFHNLPLLSCVVNCCALVLTPPRLGEGRLWTAKGDMEPSTEFP